MQRNFVLKDKLSYTMKNCMVSMATVSVILKHGVYIQNLSYIHCYLSYSTEHGLILKHGHSSFLIVSNANYLICIFINFNKNGKKSLKTHK